MHAIPLLYPKRTFLVHHFSKTRRVRHLNFSVGEAEEGALFGGSLIMVVCDYMGDLSFLKAYKDVHILLVFVLVGGELCCSIEETFQPIKWVLETHRPLSSGTRTSAAAQDLVIALRLNLGVQAP